MGEGVFHAAVSLHSAVVCVAVDVQSEGEEVEEMVPHKRATRSTDGMHSFRDGGVSATVGRTAARWVSMVRYLNPQREDGQPSSAKLYFQAESPRA